MSQGKFMRRSNSCSAIVPREPSWLKLEYEGGRHLMSDRASTRHTLERCRSARLIDVSSHSVSQIRHLADTLRRLDISNRSLRVISKDLIKEFIHLEKLDLDKNNLTDSSFPDEFERLEKLVELNLENNKMRHLPNVLLKLRQLTRLNVGSNRLEDMQGIDKFRRLISLVIENNKLENSTLKEIFSSLRRLETIYAGSNNFTDVPIDIKYLKFLQVLDVSKNALTALPNEVFKLQHLDVLNASGNKITRIPTINIKTRAKRTIMCVDLSDNEIVRFPEHLLYMSDKLDLTGNKIKVVNGNVIRKMKLDDGQSLKLEGNPLNFPPKEICESGLRSMMEYFIEKQCMSKVYRGLKVLVLGAYNSGKTSMVQTIVDEQPRLVREQERTISCDIYEASITLTSEDAPTKELDISLWDVSGHPSYTFTSYLFLHRESLILIVFNMEEYDSTKFHEMIGRWIDWVLAKNNTITAIPVGTHSDLISEDKVKKICAEVTGRISQYLTNYTKSIQKEVKKIESRSNIPPSLSEQLKLYMNLLRAKTKIYESTIAISSSNMDGFDNMCRAIEQMAIKEHFPNILKVVPSLWVEVANYIEEKGYAMQVAYMKWDEYVEECSEKFGMRHLMPNITQYLHDSGKVLWFRDNPNLQEYVFLRPSWLIDVIKQFIRHNVDEYIDYKNDDMFRFALNELKFNQVKRDLIEQGVVERDLLKCLWAGLVNTESSQAVQTILSLLVENFELAYPVENARIKSAAARSVKSDVTDLDEKEVFGYGKVRMVKLAIPWCIHDSEPEKFVQIWANLSYRPGLVSVYKFPRYIPPGLFEQITVRANFPKHNLQFQFHWKEGVVAKATANGKPVFVVMRRLRDRDGGTQLRIDVRFANAEEEIEVQQLWTVMLPLLKDCEDVISRFTGIWLVRYAECPVCRDLSFLGEWLTPKELQNIPKKICECCKKMVNTDYLVQPKERKQAEELMKYINAVEAKRKADDTSHIQEEEDETDLYLTLDNSDSDSSGEDVDEESVPENVVNTSSDSASNFKHFNIEEDDYGESRAGYNAHARLVSPQESFFETSKGGYSDGTDCTRQIENLFL
ncbi:unnamed protein product [Owenia fusiformis]|uniref:non-specific serine/threonine protein kinase n=1 Tax=Owenia fusiformis TaxID=6347 RepID=A0A8J1YBK2_OWEFU|nr:unnamed protein product [Owenia fusiformis]